MFTKDTMADTWRNCCVMLLTVMTVTSLFTGASGQCFFSTQRLSATNYWKKIKYPLYGSYSNDLNCRWVIKSARPGEVILLHDLELNLEESSFRCMNYIVVYDGDTTDQTKAMRKLCTNEDLHFYSSDRFMTITFYTDESLVRNDFTLEYKSVPASEVPFTLHPTTSTTSKPPSHGTLDTAAVIGGPVIALICIIFFAGMCRLCCRRPTQPPARACPVHAYEYDPAHPSCQGPMFMTSSAAYEGHTNAGFSSLGEGPPPYDIAVASSQGPPPLSSEMQLVAPPSYDDVIMMSGNAAQPKPE